MKRRPFNQPRFNLKNLRLPLSLKGYAYKFILVIPVLFKGKLIFSESDRDRLLLLLIEDFKGCTFTEDVSHPLFAGMGMDNKGKIVKNNNAMYIVYALQTEEGKKYFETLQLNLQKHSKEKKILIEMSPVTLL